MTSDIITAGHVAVVTGAGMGIGKAACLRFAGAGMGVAMADLPGEALDQAAAEVAETGAAVLKVPTDVADPARIAALHDTVLDRFGRVDLLMNNAVTRLGRGFEADIADWRQAIEVNLWGVIEATRAFLPDMIAAGRPAAIVNVGSKQGITNPPGHPIYNIAKSAVKTYTEALQHELRGRADNTGPVAAHLLIPGWTTTGNNAHKPGAWLPAQVVDFMVAALARRDFYILCPDDETSTAQDHKRVLWAAGDIVENRPPLSRWHPDFAEAAKRACS
ncbi:MAG: SDR family NAD(P)-dependent oxidoreductase [Alphaproteobacteria bacterium]